MASRQPAGPAISVIIPTYKHADYIEATLHSLFHQAADTPPYEIVVIDNASPDHTGQILARLAAESPVPMTVLSLPQNVGRSVARNVGLERAAGQVIAFTDSDCVPAADWLLRGWQALHAHSAGMVQGQTVVAPDVPPPFFSHFIEMDREDGSYSTCNIFYRRAALKAAGGFDPQAHRAYWEDADLGWRVRRLGWRPVYEPTAVVYHQVIPLTAWQWLLWPLKFSHYPIKAARFPEFRRYLFAGIFLDRYHAALTLALLGVVLAGWRRKGLALALILPYVWLFLRRHGLAGRFPPLKAALHLAWDLVAFGVLLGQSIRHRALVL